MKKILQICSTPFMRIFLSSLGILLVPLCMLHFTIPVLGILVNLVNVYLQRRPLPIALVVISILATFPSIVVSLYFRATFPVLWLLCAMAVSAIAALIINKIKQLRQR